MKLYIWEGNGISSAYHDDGLLVVLAESPEDARRVVADTRDASRRWNIEHKPIFDELQRRHHAFAQSHGGYSVELWQSAEGKAWLAERNSLSPKPPPAHENLPDGSDEALMREPDRVVDIDVPTIVAFNGGGYD